VDILHHKLKGCREIPIAFVFGSIARQREMAESDVDLFVIGDLGLRNLVGLLSGVSDKIGREINPHVFSLKELKKRQAQGDHFISRVLDEPKIFILGNENELEKMVR
jgi:predicted nucleotidyltransferase